VGNDAGKTSIRQNTEIPGREDSSNPVKFLVSGQKIVKAYIWLLRRHRFRVIESLGIKTPLRALNPAHPTTSRLMISFNETPEGFNCDV